MGRPHETNRKEEQCAGFHGKIVTTMAGTLGSLLPVIGKKLSTMKKSKVKGKGGDFFRRKNTTRP